MLVKKWLKRIRNRTLEDQEVLQAYSRARKRPPPQTAAEVVTRILEIRDEPPPKLGRVPGPLTILYYLQKDPSLQEAGCVLPRSTRTIWKILDQHQRIPRPGLRQHEPLERPEPGLEWGMDFHDVSTVLADPLGKQQHMVEILNFIDHGTSAVVASEPGDAYTAELPCGRWHRSSRNKAARTALSWIAIRGGWAVGPPKTFPLHYCVFCSAWVSILEFVRRSSPRKIPL